MGEGEDSLARGTPRKATTGLNLQQLDEVPRSLGGRSRIAKKVARNGTTKSWENRVGRNQFGQKSSRSLKTKAFTPGNLHQKFLGSLKGRRIKTRQEIITGGVRNSDNRGFPNIIEIGNKKLLLVK